MFVCRLQWFLFIAPTKGWHVPWTRGLVAATILFSLLLSALLMSVLVSWQQHKLLLLSLVPRAVVDRVLRKSRLSTSSPGDSAAPHALWISGSPADKVGRVSQVWSGHDPYC